MSQVPTEHIEEGLKLEAGRPIDLWQIDLNNTPVVKYFTEHETVTWQGNEYEHLPIALQGEKMTATEEASRPKLQFYNQDNLFGPIVDAGYLELAVITRRTVLQSHLKADINISQRRVYLGGRILSLSNRNVVMELRSLLDAPNFRVPARRYTTPEFPFVTYR